MHTARTSDPEPAIVDTSAGPIALTREGNADHPAVICLHGIPGSHRDFRYLAPLLAESFHVVRLDAPGFAQSPRGGAASVDGWADALWGVADALELQRCVLLAHSFGGASVLYAAARCPERTLGVALLATPGGRRHRGYGPPRWVFAAMAKLARLPLARSRIGELGRRAYVKRGLPPPERGDWRTIAHHLQLIGTLRFDRLAAIAHALPCPALVAHCADDPLVEIAIAREQAARFRTSRTLFFLSGGHHVQKNRAAEVASALREMFATR